MTSVHLTDRALLDVEEIEQYSVRNWGERVAARYLRDLDSALRRLAESPNLLQERADTSLRLRFYPVREHVLLCDVIGDRIFVLALRHAVMDLPRRLAELEPQLIHEAELFARQIAARDARGDA
jgi:toxin ParE1/3/4